MLREHHALSAIDYNGARLLLFFASNMHSTKYFPLVWDAEPTDLFIFYREYMQLLQ